MAMNYLEKKRQDNQPQQYTGLRGVSDRTNEQLGRYQGGYQPSEQTQNAQQRLQEVQQNKPQTYNSKYGAALDGILAQIQNPSDFKYSFDGDEMFKYYADLMTQNAKQGAANAMGQAVALTGGYGNSWASGQANQAYQQAILPLYERGMDLRDRAFQEYQYRNNNLMDQAGLLQGLDNADYGRHRDTVQDYYADVDRAQAAADSERNFDYNNYMDMLGYWQNTAGAENADYMAEQDNNFRQSQFDWQQSTDARDYEEAVRRADQEEAYRQQAFNENVRQADLDEAYRQQSFQQSVEEFNRTNELDWAQLQEKQREYDAGLDEEQRQYNQKIAIAYVTDILANGKMPSNDLLVAAGLSFEDAQKLMAQVQVSGRPGGPGPGDNDDSGGNTTKPMSFLEANQLIFRNTPDNLTLGDVGYTGSTADKTFGEYKQMIQNAIAERDAKNVQTVEDKLKNATGTTAATAPVLAAKQEVAKQQPTKLEFAEWLKKQGAKNK